MARRASVRLDGEAGQDGAGHGKSAHRDALARGVEHPAGVVRERAAVRAGFAEFELEVRGLAVRQDARRVGLPSRGEADLLAAEADHQDVEQTVAARADAAAVEATLGLPGG
jgi:hypothetical protein